MAVHPRRLFRLLRPWLWVLSTPDVFHVSRAGGLFIGCYTGNNWWEVHSHCPWQLWHTVAVSFYNQYHVCNSTLQTVLIKNQIPLRYISCFLSLCITHLVHPGACCSAFLLLPLMVLSSIRQCLINSSQGSAKFPISLDLPQIFSFTYFIFLT